MSDNFQVTQGSGTIIATDQVGDGSHYQKVKLFDPLADGTQGIGVASNPMIVSQSMANRSLVMKTNTLVTTAVTADQVILTYTVTVGKTFYLEYIAWDVRLTAISATASIMGAISLETPSGTKVFTATEVNPTTSETNMTMLNFPEPLPIPAGTVIRWVTTPAAATSMTWIGNFGGYEL